MRFLILFFAVTILGCSGNIDRKEYMEKIKDLKLKRSEASRSLQESENIIEINTRLLEMQRTVNDLPEISGWDKDDSLKLYFTKAINNDLDFYNKIRNRSAPSNIQDSLYFKADEVKHMERSLYYDLEIMKIIIDQEKEFNKESDLK